MNVDFKKILYALVIIVVQCILDNYVDLSIYLRIVLVPYLILILPYRYRTISAMILAFFIGLAVDIFTTGVLGINAGALTAVAFIRQKMLHAIMDERNMERHDSPDLKVMGVGKGLFYIGVPYLLFFIISVLLDNFSIRPLAITIPKILAGTIVSGVISMLLFKNYKKI
jgi:rod shape-determining protein MreD